MPPFLYPIIHQPPKMEKNYINKNDEECIPLQVINIPGKKRRRQYLRRRFINNFPIDTGEFYIPQNEFFTSCLSKRLVEKDIDEEDKLDLDIKNTRDRFICR